MHVTFGMTIRYNTAIPSVPGLDFEHYTYTYIFLFLFLFFRFLLPTYSLP